MDQLRQALQTAQDTYQVIEAAAHRIEDLTGCQEWGLVAHRYGESPRVLISPLLYERLSMMPGLHSPLRQVSEVELLHNYSRLPESKVVKEKMKHGLHYFGTCFFFPQQDPSPEQAGTFRQIAALMTDRLEALQEQTYFERILLLQVSSEETATHLGSISLALEGMKRAYDRDQPEKFQTRFERAFVSLRNLERVLHVMADCVHTVGKKSARLNHSIKTMRDLIAHNSLTLPGNLSITYDCDEAFEVQSPPGSLRLLLLKLILHRNPQKRLAFRTALVQGVPQIIIQDEDPLCIVKALETRAVKDLLTQCVCEAECSVHPLGVECRIIFVTHIDDFDDHSEGLPPQVDNDHRNSGSHGLN